MNELALFAGAGGGILGSALLGWTPICAVEKEPYCREVLLRRQRDGMLPLFPIWDDIKTFDGRPWNGVVDIISAGFPCQPWSVAGRREGESDDRNLWPDTIRVIREVGPRFALLENVPGLLRTDYFGQILGDLAESGFDARWDSIPASAIGAHFVGDRIWILASSSTPNSLRWKGIRQNTVRTFSSNEFARLVEYELSVCVPASKNKRVSDGVAHRVDRLKAIGNGQVPGVVRKAWEILQG